jgi:cell division protein FtsB
VAARKNRWKSLLLIAVLGIAAYVFLGGDSGLYRLRQRWRELDELEARVALLEAENDSLRHVLWLLENDLGYVEKVAREEYGMSKKGERVYRLRLPDEPQESE